MTVQKALIAYRAPRERFARSINIERDAGSHAINSYVPVGRAVDAVQRLAAAFLDNAERALSVTGPYGSGKSSLAVLLDALLRPSADPVRQSADALVSAAAPAVHELVKQARIRVGADDTGFIRCLATAQREPVAATVLRALSSGAQAYGGGFKSPSDRRRHRDLCAELSELRDAATGIGAQPDARAIREIAARLSSTAPLLLVIDEFGKNLEAFSDSRSAADLFLLQELAEWSRGDGAIQLGVVTLQHLAFDEYAESATVAQRREWAKVQGRFEDVPFVDSAASTRLLIANAFEPVTDRGVTQQLKSWAVDEARIARRLGLDEVADEKLLATCWPLHPLALYVLPDLCQRYGQNERTLFSFLASHTAHSVATWLGTTPARTLKPTPPSVRLDSVYDYFVEAATALVGVSHAASRWLEINTRIRDAHGLTAAQRRVLKTVGLLNLVSSGGSLRASRETVGWAAADGAPGTEDVQAVFERLTELQDAQLVTWRDFADELRVWHGSDLDIRAALDEARRRARSESPSKLLERIRHLPPLIAARHSHQTGTLRWFARHWVDSKTDRLGVPSANEPVDGVVFYALDDLATLPLEFSGAETRKPVVLVTVEDPTAVTDAAVEVAALADVLSGDERLRDDWVATGELKERYGEALATLDAALDSTYGASGVRARWSLVDESDELVPIPARIGSAALSWVADRAYNKAPAVRNDLLNRHDLSSQAAKARRQLEEGMLTKRAEERLGIQGFGPEYAMYKSVLVDAGIHRPVAGEWRLTAPPADSSYFPAWKTIESAFDRAKHERLTVDALFTELAAPPFGIRAGVAPVLFTAALVANADQVALYEHGTFRPSFTPDVFERLLRNPERFQIKHYGTRHGPRRQLLDLLGPALGGPRVGRDRAGSVLAVVSRLVQTVNALPPHIRSTRQVDSATRAIRDAISTATEPDDLLFRAIPAVLGLPPVPASGTYPGPKMRDLAQGIFDAVDALTSAYALLLKEILAALVEGTGAPASRPAMLNLNERAAMLKGRVIDPDMRKLVAALSASTDDEQSWLEYVAMMVTSSPPAQWSDDDRTAFFARVQALGGTFRRLEALHYERRASQDDGFEAFRVTVTRPDGAETAAVVWVDDAHRERLAKIVATAIGAVEKVAGNRSAARDLLIALAAQTDPAESVGSEDYRQGMGRRAGGRG